MSHGSIVVSGLFPMQWLLFVASDILVCVYQVIIWVRLISQASRLCSNMTPSCSILLEHPSFDIFSEFHRSTIISHSHYPPILHRQLLGRSVSILACFFQGFYFGGGDGSEQLFLNTLHATYSVLQKFRGGRGGGVFFRARMKFLTIKYTTLDSTLP